jgi:hypothetical protein
MGVKTQSLGKTTDPGRLEFTWAATIGRQVKAIGLPGFAPKPDLAKLKAAMDKAKKPLEWEFSFDTTKLAFKVQADVGGTVIDIDSFDLIGKEKDVGDRRELLEKIRDHTEVATTKDLEDYDKRFGNPKKAKALQEELKQIAFEIKRDVDLKKTLPTSFEKMNGGLREVGFTHWAEPLKLDRFIEFADAVENGQNALELAREFIVTGAPRFLQVKPETRAAVDAAVKAGKTPDLKAAHDDVVRIIDATILPRFRKDTIAAIDKRLGDEKKRLVAKQAELKAAMPH